MSGVVSPVGGRGRAPAQVLPLEWAVVGLMAATVMLLAVLSQAMLTAAKIHYATASGSFVEKVHPATYLVVLTLGLLLARRGDPMHEIDRILTHVKLLMVFLFCWGLLVLQCLILHRPVTGAIDTFLLPVLFALIAWSLTAQQRRPLVWVLHAFMWLNIAAGYYEYVSGHRIVPLTVGGVPIYGEWRSTAFLGSPLAASSVIALYTICLILRPALIRPALLRVSAVILALGSLMAFGGRTALVSVLVVLAGAVCVRLFSFIAGRRLPLQLVMLTICAVFLIAAAVAALLQSGAFDNMLNRFSSDKGSANTRLLSLHLVTLLDWREFAFGTDPTRGSALQYMMGLQYGIESFWLACIVQYGAICTALISIGMGGFLIELLRRSEPVARIAVLFVIVDASSSVSFSSKNITLALLIALIVLLLARERRPNRAAMAGATPVPALLRLPAH